MRLLILTQKIDKEDPVLGFFHGWVAAFAERVESITVIALGVGKYDLPHNVRVFSLGKERKLSRVSYLKNFYRLIIAERDMYDAVFVHMNQEYVLLGALPWALLGKHIFLWRNHPKGNFLTALAVFLCDKTFCTSQFSYINRFKKNELMPVGIDESLFSDNNGVRNHDVLFLGRIAPLKRPDIIIESLAELSKQGSVVTADFYGDALPQDAGFYEKIKMRANEAGLSGSVRFYPGVQNSAAPAIFSSHKIFINASPSGMYDKTIFEAALCGTLVLTSNENLRGEIDEKLLFREGDVSDLAAKLNALLRLPAKECVELAESLRKYAQAKHGLHSSLSGKLTDAMQMGAAKRPALATVTKYIISGGSAAAVDLVCLHIFNASLGIGYIVSSVFAFLIAFGVSFILQKFWAFQDESKKLKSQAALYFLITSLNLGLNTLLMYLFVSVIRVPEILGVSPEHGVLLSQIIASALVALQSFFTYQKFVFRKNQPSLPFASKIVE